VSAASDLRKELLQARKDWVGLLMTVVAPFPVLWILGALHLGTAAVPPGFPTMDPPAFAVVLTVWLSGSTAAATAILRERTAGTLQRLALTPFSATTLVAAKAALFVPVACLQAAVTLAACRAFLGSAFAARPWQVAVVFAALAMAAYGLGLLLSAACGSVTQVASATTLAAMASILWCGFFKPTSDLGAVRGVAKAMPFTVAYDAVRTAADGLRYGAVAVLAVALLAEVAVAALAVRLRSRQAGP
jgi:ABC-2 type transport system permease protein